MMNLIKYKLIKKIFQNNANILCAKVHLVNQTELYLDKMFFLMLIQFQDQVPYMKNFHKFLKKIIVFHDSSSLKVSSYTY